MRARGGRRHRRDGRAGPREVNTEAASERGWRGRNFELCGPRGGPSGGPRGGPASAAEPCCCGEQTANADNYEVSASQLRSANSHGKTPLRLGLLIAALVIP